MSKIIGVDYTSLRKTIEAARKAAGSIRKLEEQVGVTFTSLSRFLNGADPSIVSMFKMCEFSGIEPGALIVREKTRAKGKAKPTEARP